MARQIKKQGFTIPELITVIVVIGILASIGIVSYSGYRIRAAKSSAESTAQQVKLKLGEYYTDNNKYPLNTTAVDTYLRAISATSMADSFKNMTDNGATYAPLAKDGSSCQVTTLCDKYTITVPASYWQGGSDSPITVTP